MGPSKRKSAPASLEETSEKPTEGSDVDVPPVKRVRTSDAAGDAPSAATTPADRKADATPMTAEAEDQDSGEKRKRHGRKRKKKVFSEILQQMEFYFSDANIAKSSFMQVGMQLIKDN